MLRYLVYFTAGPAEINGRYNFRDNCKGNRWFNVQKQSPPTGA